MKPVHLSLESRQALLRCLVVVAGIFCLLISGFMAATWWRDRAANPMQQEAIQLLRNELRQNPGDESLRRQVRAVDLLARRAYFATRWELRTGTGLVVAGVAVLLLALRALGSLERRRMSMPDCPGLKNSWFWTVRSRQWMAAAGVAFFCISVAAGLLGQGEESSGPAEMKSSRSWEDEDRVQWSGFRGPGGNGMAAATRAPVDWDGASGRGVLWKVQVPRAGYSSPAVWGGRIFLTGADEQVREVFCFSTGEGKLQWRTAVPALPGQSTETPQTHADTGLAAPTAATDGESVFAIFPTGDLLALDMNGQIRWAQNLGLPENHYGHSSSLRIFEDLLIIQWDQNEGSRLLALDVMTGRTVWQIQRGPISWSSPVCVKTGDRWELILTNNQSVESYDPRTGKRWWGLDCLGGEMGPSAAYANGMVFVANEFARAAGLRLTAAGVEQIWEYRDSLPDTASPLATGKYVYLATSRGMLICLDAATGKELWQTECADGFYASPLLACGRIYAMDLQGCMHIFKDGGTFESLGESKLGEPSACTPAILEDRIFIRGESFLYCIGSGPSGQ